MQNIEPVLASREQKTLYGLRRPSNDKAQQRDIPELCAQLCKNIGSKKVLPLYILSREYDPKPDILPCLQAEKSRLTALKRKFCLRGFTQR